MKWESKGPNLSQHRGVEVALDTHLLLPVHARTRPTKWISNRSLLNNRVQVVIVMRNQGVRKATEKNLQVKERRKNRSKMEKIRTTQTVTRGRLDKSSMRSVRGPSTLQRREDVLKQNEKIFGKEERFTALDLRMFKKLKKIYLGRFYLLPEINNRRVSIDHPRAAAVSWPPLKHLED
jgi:hypothetical protein